MDLFLHFAYRSFQKTLQRRLLTGIVDAWNAPRVLTLLFVLVGKPEGTFHAFTIPHSSRLHPAVEPID
jgi:hypothetical protein